MNASLLALVRLVVSSWNRLGFTPEDLLEEKLPPEIQHSLGGFVELVCRSLNGYAEGQMASGIDDIPTHEVWTANLLQAVHDSGHEQDLFSMVVAIDALALNLYRWDESQQPPSIPYVYRPTAGEAIAHLDDGGSIEQRDPSGQWGSFLGSRSFFEGKHPEATDYQFVDSLRLVPLPEVEDTDTDGLLTEQPPISRIDFRYATTTLIARMVDALDAVGGYSSLSEEAHTLLRDVAPMTEDPQPGKTESLGDIAERYANSQIADTPPNTVDQPEDDYANHPNVSFFSIAESARIERDANQVFGFGIPQHKHDPFTAEESRSSKEQSLRGREVRMADLTPGNPGTPELRKAIREAITEIMSNPGPDDISIEEVEAHLAAGGRIELKTETMGWYAATDQDASMVVLSSKLLFGGKVPNCRLVPLTPEDAGMTKPLNVATHSSQASPVFKPGDTVNITDPLDLEGDISGTWIVAKVRPTTDSPRWTEPHYRLRQGEGIHRRFFTNIPQSALTAVADIMSPYVFELGDRVVFLHDPSVPQRPGTWTVTGRESTAGWNTYKVSQPAHFRDVQPTDDYENSMVSVSLVPEAMLTPADEQAWPTASSTGDTDGPYEFDDDEGEIVRDPLAGPATDGPYQFELEGPTLDQLVEHMRAGGKVEILRANGTWEDAGFPVAHAVAYGQHTEGSAVLPHFRLSGQPSREDLQATITDLKAQLSAERTVRRLETKGMTHVSPSSGPTPTQTRLAQAVVAHMVLAIPESKEKSKKFKALNRTWRILSEAATGRELMVAPITFDEATPETFTPASGHGICRCEHPSTDHDGEHGCEMCDSCPSYVAKRDPGHIYVIFDGAPGPVSGRFVEVEDHTGASVASGEWLADDRHDGWAMLKLPHRRNVMKEGYAKYIQHLNRAREALRLTAEYADLPAITGWEWFDKVCEITKFLGDGFEIHYSHRVDGTPEADVQGSPVTAWPGRGGKVHFSIKGWGGDSVLPAGHPVPEDSEVWCNGGWRDAEWVGHEGLILDAPMRKRLDQLGMTDEVPVANIASTPEEELIEALQETGGGMSMESDGPLGYAETGERWADTPTKALTRLLFDSRPLGLLREQAAEAAQDIVERMERPGRWTLSLKGDYPGHAPGAPGGWGEPVVDTTLDQALTDIGSDVELEMGPASTDPDCPDCKGEGFTGCRCHRW